MAFLPQVLRYAARVCGELRAAIDVRLQNIELVAQLRAQKQPAEDTNVAKSRFLAVASHDLRQPLHALELFVQALEDTPLPAHAHQLVGTPLGQLHAGVVRRAVGYLARIVRNLVANAVRYTERGQVTIGCRRRGAQVRIEVWDTGPGIPREQHALVFQEFTQLGSPERDRRKGLGLGLAIVERLARLLGHEVGLRSEPGKGSMFAVTVPRGRHDEQALLEPREDLAARFDLGGRAGARRTKQSGRP